MRTLFEKIPATLALCATLAAPVYAGGLDDVVRLDVLDGGVTKKGTYLGAIRLTLADGWKTYWRAPGEAGIPPSFDWRGSRNVGEVSITWPAPEVFDQNGLRSIGYEDQLVLPVEITPAKPGQPVRLKGEMDFGVCKEVCIPGNLSFDHRLDSGAGRHPAIAAALAQRPYSAREAGVKSASCRLKPTQHGLQIEARIAMPPAGGAEVAVIEPGNPALWAAETRTRRQGNTLIASSEVISNSGAAFALDRSEVRITVLGARHAVDIQGCTPG
ncbi:MAG: protein-disulfide reductase DsbD domain-containing protein [Ruegeria sp.]|uniref:protein-disulfide reductase DsbD domain-containing protein n=1 Tax=Ruegeria sp. TaxID=1879320 RepID=UPI00349E83CC